MLARLDPLHVEAFVPVGLYSYFSRGLVGEVRTGEMMDNVHTATVTVTDHAFDTSSGTCRVRLALPNPDARMPAGQRSEVYFDFEP